MYFKHIILSSLLFCAGLVADVSVNMGQFTLNGTVSAGNGVFNVGRLSGNGTISGHNFKIKCDEFNFTGTIECSEECVIRVKKPFDYAMFKRQGTGSITVIVSPYDFQPYTETELITTAKDLFLTNYAKTTEEATMLSIGLIRYWAASNAIDEKKVFDPVMEQLNQRLAHHLSHRDEKYDATCLPRIATDSAALCIGLIPAYLAYKNKIENQVLLTVAAVSAFAAFAGAYDGVVTLLDCVNPRHEAKIATLMMIKNRINQALQVPYVLEKEEIIKLQ